MDSLFTVLIVVIAVIASVARNIAVQQAKKPAPVPVTAKPPQPPRRETGFVSESPVCGHFEPKDVEGYEGDHAYAFNYDIQNEEDTAPRTDAYPLVSARDLNAARLREAFVLSEVIGRPRAARPWTIRAR